ncbi:MAG: carboxypeptidase regulatory-like domain-containing protein [bacterium]|nr:carboxypeptidase regulatory-like domain-containing protein [bacterium]
MRHGRLMVGTMAILVLFVGCTTLLGGTAQLDGQVVLEETRMPVTGEVSVFEGPNDPMPVATVKTGGKGRFELPKLRPATYYVEVAPDDLLLCQVGDPLEVNLFNSPVMSVRLEVTGACAIAGTVLSADGRAVKGAQIGCEPVPPAIRPRPVVTDGDGRFVIGNLPYRSEGYSLHALSANGALSQRVLVEQLEPGVVTEGVTVKFRGEVSK